MNVDLGAGERRLAEYLARVGDIQQRAEETQARLRELRAQVSSPDRSVSVEMAPGGRLERLSLTPQAMQYGPERLAALISETIQRGHAAVAEQMQETMRPLLGDSPAMEFLGEHIGLAQQDDDETGQPPVAPTPPDSPQRPASRGDDDDDTGFDSVWKD